MNKFGGFNDKDEGEKWVSETTNGNKNAVFMLSFLPFHPPPTILVYAIAIRSFLSLFLSNNKRLKS